MSVLSLPSWLQPGCPVEVVGRAEDGFPASFSEAEVCSTSAAAEGQVPKVQVKYNDVRARPRTACTCARGPLPCWLGLEQGCPWAAEARIARAGWRPG